MRIISGSARGRKLTPFDGRQIRPTPDRVREALFSLLISRMQGLHDLSVLELFAGTGAQSLEAISRGARRALLVDQSAYAVNIIQRNIAACGFAEQTRVIHREVQAALPGISTEAPFDLIFLDPPYHSGLIPAVLEKIAALNLLANNGIICVETASNETVAEQPPFSPLTQRRYGSTTIHLFGYARDNQEP